MKIKQFVGDRAFYKMALTVAIPMMLQNFITNFVNMLDNIMVGALGTEQMSGVSIVNQLIFVFNLAIFGGMGGVGIFTAQFYGKGDNGGIRCSFRYKFVLALILCAAAGFIFAVFDERLISLFLHDTGEQGDVALTLDFAQRYLKIILLGFVPFALANVFSGTLRETGDTFTPMMVGLFAVIVNCVFNYCLIFGKLGFPQLGVEGAAIATVLSRFAECILIAVYAFLNKKRFPYISGVFKSLYIPKEIFSAISKKGLPLLLNEILWSGGMSTLSVAFSLHGLSVVAGYSISSTVTNLFNIAFLSMGTSIGIISGRLLGANEHEKAVDTVRKLIAFSVFLSTLIGVLMFILGGQIPLIYKTSEQSKELATYFIRVCAFTAPLAAFANACYFTLRSGGKTVITSLFDCGSLWLISVPLAFLLYKAAGMNIYWVFPIVQSLEIIKVVLGLIFVRKKIWVRTII